LLALEVLARRPGFAARLVERVAARIERVVDARLTDATIVITAAMVMAWAAT